VSADWLVLKFGGTSVSGRAQWEAIAALARQRLDDGHRVVLVCSAVSGITDALQGLLDHAAEGAEERLDEIRRRHHRLARELGVKSGDLVDRAMDDISRLLPGIADTTHDSNRYRAIASLLSLGEWLSTRIGARFLAQRLPVEWVDVREALQALPEADLAGRRSWLSARCDSRPDRDLQGRWLEKSPLLITQGFIAAHAAGATALLGRGGSDTSAALLAGRLQARQIEIWTDVPGLFSADPRVLEGARLLQRLSYEEALEMAASGAKVVHPRCIRAASDCEVPVHVRDLGRPDLAGTIITHGHGAGGKGREGIRAVCHQPRMAVLLLRNLDTREHVGFLAWVFAQVSAEGLSVDQVATSETTTTIALNRVSNHLDDATLQRTAARLQGRCEVCVYPRCSGINLVGRGARTALAHIDSGHGFFADHPLLMLSQSANDLCISMLLQEQDAPELVRSLHRALIEDRAGSARSDEVFGPRWQDLRG
jgi:diaminopimelate decarboxylase/aspartate kinase